MQFFAPKLNEPKMDIPEALLPHPTTTLNWINWNLWYWPFLPFKLWQTLNWCASLFRVHSCCAFIYDHYGLICMWTSLEWLPTHPFRLRNTVSGVQVSLLKHLETMRKDFIHCVGCHGSLHPKFISFKFHHSFGWGFDWWNRSGRCNAMIVVVSFSGHRSS